LPLVGSVGVYSVVTPANKIELMYQSTAKTGKHTDPVWQVRQQTEITTTLFHLENPRAISV